MFMSTSISSPTISSLSVAPGGSASVQPTPQTASLPADEDNDTPDEEAGRPSYRSEYRKNYRPFYLYQYVDGSWKRASKNEDAADGGSGAGSATPGGQLWYQEVSELRRQAGLYRCRGWGTGLTSDHLAELHTRQAAALMEGGARRRGSITSPLFLTPRSERSSAERPSSRARSVSKTRPRSTPRERKPQLTVRKMVAAAPPPKPKPETTAVPKEKPKEKPRGTSVPKSTGEPKTAVASARPRSAAKPTAAAKEPVTTSVPKSRTSATGAPAAKDKKTEGKSRGTSASARTSKPMSAPTVRKTGSSLTDKKKVEDKVPAKMERELQKDLQKGKNPIPAVKETVETQPVAAQIEESQKVEESSAETKVEEVNVQPPTPVENTPKMQPNLIVI